MRYLIDTNICIYIMNQRPKAVIEKCRQCQPGDIGISTVTVSELRYGVAKSSRPEENAARLGAFLAPFIILAYDDAAAGVYGDVRFYLEKQGRPIGPLDMMIAAHAMSLNATLVTNNEKEFRRIKTLKVENWAF
ncbi:MAG: type II toxin-antitoxin system VapC family toxin [Desulfobacterales bacterium]|nr:type II toxin-antitoxin system VapC family toxin [Desulfobacterales bacterium]